VEAVVLEWICDRCGDVTLKSVPCRCRTPFDPVDVVRRHRQAVMRARRPTDAERPVAVDPYRAA
jgi:hypothetical protein